MKADTHVNASTYYLPMRFIHPSSRLTPPNPLLTRIPHCSDLSTSYHASFAKWLFVFGDEALPHIKGYRRLLDDSSRRQDMM